MFYLLQFYLSTPLTPQSEAEEYSTDVACLHPDWHAIFTRGKDRDRVRL